MSKIGKVGLFNWPKDLPEEVNNDLIKRGDFDGTLLLGELLESIKSLVDAESAASYAQDPLPFQERRCQAAWFDLYIVLKQLEREVSR